MTVPDNLTPPLLSVVVPTYNERTRIGELIAAVFQVFAGQRLDGELVVVDDNSPDGTGAIVDGLLPHYGGRLQVVHRSGKLGLGTAVMEGFAASHGRRRRRDGRRLQPSARGSAAALSCPRRAARRRRRRQPVRAGGRVENWPFSRLMMSRAACVLARPLTPVRDATSGFFLARRTAVEGITIGAGGFKICLELLLRGRIASVAEVPYVFTDRAVGESKMSTREALGYLTQLRQLYGLRFLSAGGGQRPRYVPAAPQPAPSPRT